MRIVGFDKAGTFTLGVKRGDELVDLSVAAPELPGDLTGLLAAGADALARVKAVAENPAADAVVSTERLVYRPPTMNPQKILCVGLNYGEHADESATVMDRPTYPVVFTRAPTSLVAHQEPLIVPKVSSQLDFEGEMAVFIGKAGRAVSKDQALSLVAGYSVFNDASVRDYQFKAAQWTMGKNFDGTGGFGPEFVSADELPSGGSGLSIQTRLNDEVMQNDNTKNLIFDLPTLIEVITEVMTLLPGDVIVTGTPGGVGFVRKPPIFMKRGDFCEVEIEGIGTLINPIVEEA